VGCPYCFGRCRFSYHDDHLNVKKYSLVGNAYFRQYFDHLRRSFLFCLVLDRVPKLSLYYNQDVIICAPPLFSGSPAIPLFLSTLCYQALVTALEIHPSLNKVELYILDRRRDIMHHPPKACRSVHRYPAQAVQRASISHVQQPHDSAPHRS
jgi:hypothetical protein